MSRMKLRDEAQVVAVDHARTLGVVRGPHHPGAVFEGGADIRAAGLRE